MQAVLLYVSIASFVVLFVYMHYLFLVYLNEMFHMKHFYRFFLVK